jgi:hypothetical protein
MIGWCRIQGRIQGWGQVSDENADKTVRLARMATEAGRDDPDTL